MNVKRSLNKVIHCQAEECTDSTCTALHVAGVSIWLLGDMPCLMAGVIDTDLRAALTIQRWSPLAGDGLLSECAMHYPSFTLN